MSEPCARVLFFAGARDLVGAAEIIVAVPTSGCTVAALRDRIAERYPALVPHLRAIRFAVNGEYARADDPVRAGDEVAVIPPVSGG